MKRSILLAISIGLSILLSSCTLKSELPAFVGTVSRSYSLGGGGEPGSISLYAPIDGQTWAYRAARCAVTPQTVFAQPNYRKPASEVGGLENALAAVEGSVVAVTGMPQDGAIACTEVSMTAGPPVMLPWEAESSALDAPTAIPMPLPSGTALEVTGDVVLGDSAGSEGVAFLGVVDSPLSMSGNQTEPTVRIQYFLVDSSTMMVEGNVRRPVTADDIEGLYAQGLPTEVTARLVVTSDAAYAQEIERR